MLGSLREGAPSETVEEPAGKMRFAIIYNLRILLPSPYGATFLSEEGLGAVRTNSAAVFVAVIVRFWTVLLLCNSGRTVPTNCVVRTDRRATRIWFLRGRGGVSPPAVSVAVFVSFREHPGAPLPMRCPNFLLRKRRAPHPPRSSAPSPQGKALVRCEQTAAP